MRILHVLSTLDPAAGGPPVVAARLAAAQAAIGHDVSILSYRDPARAEAIEQMFEGMPHTDKITNLFATPSGRLERIRAADARRVGADAIKDADVAHLHGVWDPILPAVASDCRKHHTPYCVVPHGMLDLWSMQQSSLKKRVALAVKYRSFLNHAAFIHILNADEAKGMHPLGLSAPTEVIPNGIFLDEFDPPPAVQPFLDAYPQLAGNPYLLFLSRIHFKKGLDVLADAFAHVAQRHDDLHLVVAGPEDGAGDDFRDRIERAGLTERVLMPGPIYGELKLAAVAGADCFCLPSRQEGFSIAITEALACATPVVITTDCHYPEVTEANAGIETAVDAQETADAIERVLADPAEAKRMGERGRALVEERFTWPKVAQLTDEAYQRQLKS